MSTVLTLSFSCLVVATVDTALMGKEGNGVVSIATYDHFHADHVHSCVCHCSLLRVGDDGDRFVRFFIGGLIALWMKPRGYDMCVDLCVCELKFHRRRRC